MSRCVACGASRRFHFGRRTFRFFDDQSIDAARAAWRSVKGRDSVEPRYWKQDENGRWTQMA